jgi:hypothetical protein
MDSAEDSWDVVEDLPLRWASDYVSLAISGSRLANTSVLFYDIWSDTTIGGHKGALLAVVTKSTVLLYETPKGERAFRFVKVSYLSYLDNYCWILTVFFYTLLRNSISRRHLEQFDL